MHELSIANSISEIVLAEARRHDATTVSNVTVRIGPIHQIVVDLLQSAFQAVTPGTLLENARLTIVETPLTLCCDACGRTRRTDEFQLICPACRSPDVTVLGGDEFVVADIEMEVRDERPSDAQCIRTK